MHILVPGTTKQVSCPKKSDNWKMQSEDDKYYLTGPCFPNTKEGLSVHYLCSICAVSVLLLHSKCTVNAQIGHR